MEPGSLLIAPEPTKAVLPERPVPGKPLGRHIHHDARSRSYPADRATAIGSVRHPAIGLPLKQHDTHRCGTAHALCAAVNSARALTPGRPALTEADAVAIYETATRIEAFGTDTSPVAGSSALMACKAAVQLGYIQAYEHAFGIEHALEALMLRPVMSGISWYSSFDSPDPGSGLVRISPDASVRGGHEVLADEIDPDRQLVWFWNSWGSEFGIAGRFCMTFDTWERLLGESGDVTVPIV